MAAARQFLLLPLVFTLFLYGNAHIHGGQPTVFSVTDNGVVRPLTQTPTQPQATTSHTQTQRQIVTQVFSSTRTMESYGGSMATAANCALIGLSCSETTPVCCVNAAATLGVCVTSGSACCGNDDTNLYVYSCPAGLKCSVGCLANLTTANCAACPVSGAVTLSRPSASAILALALCLLLFFGS
eukprot:gnl/Spiro4/7792_TR4102_c0_g1_i1.p1 gnl/Spiro4/7792_TR4102_c0_g1~~gnl/Spiro4/7792_TR4102_c0_g1_i1.p1  ORF type:complete len:184 (-),score=15.82 gnl/Spiro4/7792_TR4102_c0_g1_i1:242-793(-)